MATMPRLITSYILKEITAPFLLSLTILTMTSLLSKVIKLVELMVTHGIGPLFILHFLASVIPSFLIYTIPIAFLIAVLVAFTRLSSDSEITAMKASGLSVMALMKPVWVMATIAALATLACTFYLFPWGNMNLKRLLVDAARSRIVSGLEEKTFYDRFKGIVLYIDRLSPITGEMEGIFISKEGDKTDKNVFFANRGEFAPSDGAYSVYLKLYDGSIHGKTEKAGSYHIADFSRYTIELSMAGGGDSPYSDKPNREMYVWELASRASDVAASGADAAPYLIDLHKRFSLPASIFVFAILGVPLGIQKVRAARFTGFSMALGVVLAYYVVSTALEAMGENGALNPILAVWGSDVIFGSIGLYILYLTSKDAPVTLMSVITLHELRRKKGGLKG